MNKEEIEYQIKQYEEFISNTKFESSIQQLNLIYIRELIRQLKEKVK